MANRAFNLTAELNVRGPSNLRVIAADIRRQLGSINVDINPNINANANRNITNLNNSLRTLNATLAATQTSATNAANAIRNFSQAISNVGTRNINQTLTTAAAAAQTLGNNATNAGRNIGQAATQMEEFGRQSALAVRRFAAFSIVTSTIYGLISAVNGGVKAFISFDKEFVRLQQVTGESAKGLRSLASEITRLSTSLGVSSEDLTTVSVTLAQAGLSATETRKALQALARSALAPSFDDLNETVEGSIALMRQFGISADQLEGALGSVNAVAAKFAVEASDLIAAIQRTGGVFATASRGVSEGTDALNEFLAVFTSIRATTRESAETIATGLRTIFTRIQRQDTVDALQNLGIELRNAQGQFVGAFEAVRRLSEGLSKIDPRSKEFSAISEELGGFRQIGKVIPLIQQFATAQQALKVAQTGQASLAEDAVVAQRSVANQIAKVREEFTALIRSIGESDSFRSFVKLSLDLASALIQLADSAKTVLPALTAIAAFKGVSALTQFGRGFAGGIGGGRRFATGGLVPGSGNRDTVPAMLTPGEFVIRKKAVQTIGIDKLSNLNKGGRVQKFAIGGEAQAVASRLGKGRAIADSWWTGMFAGDEILFDWASPTKAFKTSDGSVIEIPQNLRKVLRERAQREWMNFQDKNKKPTKPLTDEERANLRKYDVSPEAAAKIKQEAEAKKAAAYAQRTSRINWDVEDSGRKNRRPEDYLRRFRGYNSGGLIQKFAGGGLVDDIRAGNKTVGAAVLEKGEGARTSSFNITSAQLEKIVGSKLQNLPTLGKFTAIRQGLGPKTSTEFNKALNNGIISGVNRAGSRLSKGLGLEYRQISQADSKAFLSGINDAARGNLFEDVLTAIRGGPFAAREPQQPFDFPAGVGGILKDDYAQLPSRWVDAKASFKTAQVTGSGGSLRNKTLRQIRNEINNNPSFFKVPQTQQLDNVEAATFGRLKPGQTFKVSDSSVFGAKINNQNVQGLISSGFLEVAKGKAGERGASYRVKNIPGMAQGGNVDSVPALLTPGEFVINKKAASRIGSSNLQQLNRADKIQGFNKGGVVQRFFDGGGVVSDPNIPARELGETSKKVRELALALKKMGMSTKEALDAARAQVEQLSPTAQAISQQAQAKQQARTERKAAALGIDPTMTGSRRAAEARGDTGGQVGVTAATRQYAAQTYGKSSMQLASEGFAAKAAATPVAAAHQLDTKGIYSGLSKLTGALSRGSGSVSQFAASVKAAPVATFNAALKQAGSGLLQVGKMGLGAAGKGVGGLISKVGGGVLGAVGLGGAGRAAAGGAAGAAGAAGGAMGGGGVIGLVATMAGGVIVDSLSKSLGGETTESGRMVGSMGSQALNYGAIGATIGSVIPGVGTALGGLIGAAAGLTMGFFEAQKAGEEYAQTQRKAAAEQAMEKSGAAISKFAQTGSTADRAAAISSFTQAAAAEQELGAGVKRGKGEDLGDFIKRKAETQLAGAEQAEQFLTASMMQSGQTFDELSKSMKPSEFATLTQNIAEADQTYIAFQTQRAAEIAKLVASGRTAEADALQAQTNTEQQQLVKNIAERKLQEASAAAAAQKAANATKAMAIAAQTVALSLEKAFDAVGQALNKVSFEIDDASSKIDEIISGQASLLSSGGQRAANILANPEAYSARERRSAMGRGAQIMGSAGGQAMRLAELGPQIRNEATRIAIGQQASGANNQEVGNTIKDTLRRQIEDTFGVGSPMAETAIRSMESNIDKAVEEAGQNAVGTLDVQSVVADAMSPITKVSEQAAKAIQQANEVVSQNLKALGEVAQKVAELEQKRISRTAALEGMRAQTGDAVSEALGIQLSSAQKAQTRVTERATRVGVSPAAYGAGSLLQRRQQLMQQQEFLTNRARQAEAAAPTNPQAARELAQFQSQLAVVNSTLKDVDNQLEELPQTLQEQIGDVIGEMQARVAQLQAQREAGTGLAEKIVTSTPQELQGMASTYNLLTNTLKGNITTIKDSQVAQKAYFEAIRQGKSAQEAMNDAQSAFAEENKKALSMFNELSQVAGIQGPELDRMRADLISGFAKASGQANNPFIQKMVSELRKDPAQRAANDPQLMAQRKMLEDLQKQQEEATRQLNDENAKTQKEVLTTGLQPLVTAFQNAANQITLSIDKLAAATGTRFASGGMVYASKGRLINFQPKGTDTVPAMLTPGEFVVNRKATQKNLGLLRAINNGQSTDGNYAVGGVVNSGTPTLDQNTINRAVSNNINNFQNTLSNVDKNTSHTRKVIDKQVSQTQLFNKGGVVYASSGKLIKGTDTVPAMLTPGEFVVNRASAQKNLPLLQSINRSKGGPVYLARGGSVLEDELGPVMGDYYRGAIQQATQEGKWFITDKNRSLLYTQDGNQLLDYDLAQLIEQKNNMASVLAPDGKSATKAATEKYDWFSMDDRVAQASVWYTKKFNKLIQDVKKDKAYLFKEAYDREIGKFPDLFEIPNAAIGIRGNQDAFSEMPELPDPKSKFVTEYIKDKDKAKTINELLQNRFNFLTLIGKNNKEAEEIFSTDPKTGMFRLPFGNIFKPYQDTATTQVVLAGKELVNISALMAQTPELQRFPKIANRFEGSRLFDPSDPAVDLNYKNIISRNYNRGGIVYAKDGMEVPSKQRLPYKPRVGPLPYKPKAGPLSSSPRDVYLEQTKAPVGSFNESKTKKIVLSRQQALKELAILNEKESETLALGITLSKKEKDDLNERRRELEGIIKLQSTKSKNYARGGTVYANNGQLINFQPKGTDTVPAMLTPGEFVVNRKASQQNAGLLHAINSGNYSSGGPVYLANGTPMSYEERQRQRREAYEQQRAMRAAAYQARTGQLMTGAGPAPSPAQQRQQPAQANANGFEIKISREAQDFLTTLTTKIDSFGQYIDRLAAINIPDKIELNITAQPIEVRITGSAALENMSEGIRNMIAGQVNAKMSEIWNQSGGELGSRPA